LDLADQAGVIVEFHPFAEPLLGYYFAEPPLPPTIGLNATLPTNERLMRCVLAEELGHHYTSIGDHVATPYRTYLGRVLLGRTEKRALAWAAEALMPSVSLGEALGQAHSIQEVAEAYWVTPGFVRAVLELPFYQHFQALERWKLA